MLFYLPLVAAVPILYRAFYRNEHRDRIILSSMCIIMFLLLALRKPFSDVKSYQVMYEELRGVPFGDIIRDFHLVKACAISGCEWGYSFICWVFSNIGLHFQFFLVFRQFFCGEKFLICITGQLRVISKTNLFPMCQPQDFVAHCPDLIN